MEDRGRFFLGDCMDLMAELPDGYFDLAICDPPYGIGASRPSRKPSVVKQKNGSVLSVANADYGKKSWDDTVPGEDYFRELLRVSKRQIVFGVNYFASMLPGPGRIVWDKLNGDTDQFGCEIAYCSMNRRTDIVYYMWSGMFQGAYCGKDVRRAIYQQGNKKLNEKRIHPTQKPVALYRWLLNEYVEDSSWRILDTHLGSMSIAIACYERGLHITGTEKDEEIFSAAMSRYRGAAEAIDLERGVRTKQPSLFDLASL